MLLLLSFYPVWGATVDEAVTFDEALWIRVVPSVLAVLAIVEAAAGFLYMESNRSSYVLTVLYAHAKIISLLVLVCGANRLLLGEGGDGGGVAILGIPLAFLQAVKIASAFAAAINYLRGRPDEQLPTLRSAMTCHLCLTHA